MAQVDDDSAPSSSSSSTRRSRARGSTGVSSVASTSVAVDDGKMNRSNQQTVDVSSSFLMSLENYYYGTISPDISNANKAKNKELNMKVGTKT